MTRAALFNGLALLLALPFPALACAQTGDDKPSEKVQSLINQLTNRNPETRRQAAVTLGQLGDEAKAAVPALVRRVGDNQASRKAQVVAYVDASRLAALAALQKIAPDRVREALDGAARSRIIQVRAWAVRTLKAMK
jgi:HEAT repeat protein